MLIHILNNVLIIVLMAPFKILWLKLVLFAMIMNSLTILFTNVNNATKIVIPAKKLLLPAILVIINNIYIEILV